MMKRLKLPGAYYAMRSFTHDSVGSHIPAPDLGLSTRSLVRRARAAGQTLESFVAQNPNIKSSMIFRDSQIREYATPVPTPPDVQPAASDPVISQNPAPQDTA